MDSLIHDNHKVLILICFTIISFLLYRKEDILFMQSFILSKGLQMLISQKMLTARMTVNVVAMMRTED